MTDPERVPPGVDATRATPARIYDYMLGGTNNFQVDREALARAKTVVPDLHDIAWANRGFHQRAAKWIAGQGIDQFIDIGSGLPTAGNTHEAVRRVVPEARVVYVDHDPMVATQAEELLAGEGGTAVITADLREPDAVLGHPELGELVDFGRPAGLLMTAVLQFVADGSDPWGLLKRYLGALAPGSYLALTHVTADNLPPRATASARAVYADATEQMYLRTKAQIERFFDGLELVPPYLGAEPSVVHMGLWGCEDPELADSEGSRWGYGGVARRP